MTTYSPISMSEATKLPPTYLQAAHAFLYAKQDGMFLGKYEKKYAVMMQMRFDGTLGFPGGVLDEGETPDHACSRECWEELGVHNAELTITPDDHVFTHYSQKTHMVLHFFAKEILLDLFHGIESKVPLSKDWGNEVLGLIRCPLYTLPNSLGLPAFLKNQFIGNSREQLLEALIEKELLTEEEVKAAIEKSGVVNCAVTKESIEY